MDRIVKIVEGALRTGIVTLAVLSGLAAPLQLAAADPGNGGGETGLWCPVGRRCVPPDQNPRVCWGLCLIGSCGCAVDQGQALTFSCYCF
jgi:hypothetical protein